MRDSLPFVFYLIGAVATASSLSVERKDWPMRKVLAAWLLLVALWPALWIATLLDLANKDTNHATAREVEELRAEVARYRVALQQIAAGALPCTTAKAALEGKGG